LHFAREGTPFILVPLILAVVLVFFWWIPALVFALLALFMAYFFRDPERAIPAEPGIVVSPADGRVTRVERVDPNDSQSPTLVSIFLSPLDVHINRAPISGEIVEVAYTRGKFLMATDARASLLNEQNSLTIKGSDATIVCKQIAGILARRIVCWKKPSDTLSQGERFGLIKFSSRTDILMPPNIDVTVNVGSKVKGGTSIVGRFRL